MPKRKLNDRTLKALKPEPGKKLFDVMDTVTPGFGVRVSETGRLTFILITRYPGSQNPTRRALGEYGELTLAKAREKARDWLEQIGKGRDPKHEEERQRLAEARKRANTFPSTLDDYCRERVIGPNPDKPRQRYGRQVQRDLTRVFVPRWADRPITDITSRDVREVIEAVRDNGTDGDGPAPGHARNLLSYLKTFFKWVVESEDYGLESSPAERLKAARLFGEREASDRTLNDDELFLFWRAARRMRYPYGPLYQLLLLTGLRVNEVADATWPEFDLAKRIWVVPAARMKGKNGKARPHTVPLTDDMLAILETLPRFAAGDHLFSTTFGRSPVWVSDKIKKRLDRRMLRTLRAVDRKRGNDPEKPRIASWVNHDLRRTLRSRLSELRVNSDVAEAVLAHIKPGIRGVYDRYEFYDEKRHALELWACHLRTIAEPPPTNVVALRAGHGTLK